MLSDYEKCVLLALVYHKRPMNTVEIKTIINQAETPENIVYQRVRYFLKQMQKKEFLEQVEPEKFWPTDKGMAALKVSRDMLFSLAF